jgi:hypothetical protein
MIGSESKTIDLPFIRIEPASNRLTLRLKELCHERVR